jgi:RNA polymerase sigma-70 factor, ECF subfamily
MHQLPRPIDGSEHNSQSRDYDVSVDCAEGPAARNRDPDKDFALRIVSAQDRVFRFIMTLVCNPTDAEDLLQETLFTAWKNRDRFDSSRDFVRWACGIAHNHVRNYLPRRRNGAVSLSIELLAQLAQAHLEDEGILEARQRALTGCLAKLPKRDRTLIERCYARGATINGVADRAGKSANVVYKALRHIRAALYDCITRTLREEAK